VKGEGGRGKGENSKNLLSGGAHPPQGSSLKYHLLCA
jgi:hypothetical protein